MPIQADISNDKSLEKMLSIIAENNLYPSYVVHLASSKVALERFAAIPEDKFKTDIGMALGVIKILKGVMPNMIKRKSGKIIIMLSSYVCNLPPKFCSSYVTSKYALLGLVKSLSVEYAAKGICVNGISPAMINTKFLSDTTNIIRQQNADSSPAGKLLEVNDIVPTIEFLLSDAANNITGQNIEISGVKNII